MFCLDQLDNFAQQSGSFVVALFDRHCVTFGEWALNAIASSVGRMRVANAQSRSLEHDKDLASGVPPAPRLIPPPTRPVNLIQTTNGLAQLAVHRSL